MNRKHAISIFLHIYNINTIFVFFLYFKIYFVLIENYLICICITLVYYNKRNHFSLKWINGNKEGFYRAKKNNEKDFARLRQINLYCVSFFIYIIL